MASEKRLIDGNKAQAVLVNMAEHLLEAGNQEMAGAVGYAAEVIGKQKTVDAVEVVLIKEVSQKILETLDCLIAVDEPLANYTAPSSYYRGKVNAYEVARRLVNAAMADLYDNYGAKMDEAEADV